MKVLTLAILAIESAEAATARPAIHFPWQKKWAAREGDWRLINEPMEIPMRMILLALSLLAVSAAAAEKPNIVFLLADDLGYGDLACYGNPVITTPNLDQLAADGVKLLDCYAASPNCSPARTGIMTGRSPYRVGMYDFARFRPMHIPMAELTLPEVIGSAGYSYPYDVPVYGNRFSGGSIYGYTNDPYASGRFKAPDLLNDPLFQAQHKFDSQFPGRYSRKDRVRYQHPQPSSRPRSGLFRAFLGR